MSTIFRDVKGYGNLDYVSAWFLKAAIYIKNTTIKVGFVSTNSITQGEQANILWKELFKKNGFEVSDTSYFVYCNGIRSKERFDKKLEFTIKLIPYKGNSDWVDNTLNSIHENLNSDISPNLNDECEWCRYRIGK